MVKPEWDFKGGESMEMAIERFKTDAIPEFLNRIVKEAKTDHFMVIYPLPPAPSQYFICLPQSDYPHPECLREEVLLDLLHRGVQEGKEGM